MSTVDLFSSDIGMSINVHKSAKLIVSRGRIVSSDDFKLNSFEVIKCATWKQILLNYSRHVDCGFQSQAECYC